MFFERGGVGWILMQTVVNNVLIVTGDLHVVGWFKLTITHVVFFHPHKGGIGIGFGITVALA
jgi:hypothetical protein